MSDNSTKYLLAAGAGFTLSMVALAIVGGVRAYSPVPYWDMWDGYLNFFLRTSAGDSGAWWAQQAEHRIVLSHALFWLDLRYFSGRGLFLVVVNYLLAAAGALLFYRIILLRTGRKPAGAREVALGLGLTAWLFQWMQQENLAWAFQSQFLLAQLLPLWALYWLSKSVGAGKVVGAFFLACVLGVVAVGTMANGVLILPLMTAYAMCLRQGTRRVGLLAALSALMLYLYLRGFHRPGDHASVLDSFAADPFGIVAYVLRYFGSPFYHLAGAAHSGKLLALLAGVFFVGATMYQVQLSVRMPRDPLSVALLFFIAYLGVSALAIACGRLFLGADQVFASRYTTPALMAWATLLTMSLRPQAPDQARSHYVWWLALPLAVAMLMAQWKAWSTPNDSVHDRSVASLALALGVRDQERISAVYPNMTWALQLAEQASAARLSVFGAPPLRGIKAALGTTAPVAPPALCDGRIDEVSVVPGDARYVRVYGWLDDPKVAAQPDVIRLLGANRLVAGYALPGRGRPDALPAHGKGAAHAAFEGYLQREGVGDVVVLQTDRCQFTARARLPPFSLAAVSPAPLRGVIGADALKPDNQWLGRDFERKDWPNMEVRGSWIHGDADVGRQRMRIRRGQRLFYRSGPTGGRQLLELVGPAGGRWVMPVAVNWVALDFSSPGLPEGDIDVVFSDEGGDFGEWSAIAVTTNKAE